MRCTSHLHSPPDASPAPTVNKPFVADCSHTFPAHRLPLPLPRTHLLRRPSTNLFSRTVEDSKRSSSGTGAEAPGLRPVERETSRLPSFGPSPERPPLGLHAHAQRATDIFCSNFEARPDADRSRLKVWNKKILSTPVHQVARGATRPSTTLPPRILTVSWHVPRCGTPPFFLLV